ncbi:oxygen-independent coproporphyrinogen III oxidase [Roseospira visakhapatnamensis]|uniref:Coproporphyrinogen-III oxidase n=1 Tax=Roseospira visakhapatnamensis TaxID=390880 RepID=A0A7W6RDH1_9PROT|nr:oxygen-independent coproporphyrinogen III oxidase [Roseospira visakhapatnamensis]MBB4265888.1 oxygen-independent coproporphyrinogen-3 oxidase [Roseospira visakhapatnamensis]
MTIQDLAAKYDLRLPRYTSYPTAPHFSATVGSETYARWLGELDPATPLSLYTHVAYCDEMCFFCGCHTKVAKRYDPVADYLDALLTEIDLIAGLLPARMGFKFMHFGGGSPTILTAEDFSRLIRHLRDRFTMLDGAEIAVEMDPRTATEDYVKAMADVGVTRASIGVQDFEETVQKAVNRVQPFELVEQVIAWLRKHGIEDINMDLMYGLPHQTTESICRTIDRALALRPRRVSYFGYAHVPWMRSHMKMIPEDALPSVTERWSQYLKGSQRFSDNGYVTVGLDHFAAPDDELALALGNQSLHRNFQGYTTDTAEALIAFGASGIGSLPQGYIGNQGEIGAYKRTVRAGTPPITRGLAVSHEDKVRRAIIERLMCDLGVDLETVAAEYGASADDFESELSRMADLESDGIVIRDGARLRVTDLGRPLVRAVCAKFDQYLNVGEKRHSQAV